VPAEEEEEEIMTSDINIRVNEKYEYASIKTGSHLQAGMRHTTKYFYQVDSDGYNYSITASHTHVLLAEFAVCARILDWVCLSLGITSSSYLHS
jgi:hypothetical protein